MVHMYDIELDGTTGYARCIPENDDSRMFEMEFDIKEHKVLFVSDPAEFSYAGKAMSKLCRIYKEKGVLPETAMSYWV